MVAEIPKDRWHGKPITRILGENEASPTASEEGNEKFVAEGRWHSKPITRTLGENEVAAPLSEESGEKYVAEDRWNGKPITRTLGENEASPTVSEAVDGSVIPEGHWKDKPITRILTDAEAAARLKDEKGQLAVENGKPAATNRWHGKPIKQILTDAEETARIASSKASGEVAKPTHKFPLDTRPEIGLADAKNDTPSATAKISPDDKPEVEITLTSTRPDLVDQRTLAWLSKAGVEVMPRLTTLKVDGQPVRCVEFQLPASVPETKPERNAFLENMGFSQAAIAAGMDKAYTDGRWTIKVPNATMKALSSKANGTLER